MSEMRFTIEQKTLVAMLDRAATIVDKKSDVGVLAHVHLETRGKDAVRISATNYDVGLLATHAASVHEDGSCCINGTKALAMAKRLAPGDVLVALHPGGLHISQDAAGLRFELPVIPAEDYPEQREPDVTGGYVVAPGAIESIIARTAFSVCNDESRMHLNGICLTLDADTPQPGTITARAVSTDGHRLSNCATSFEDIEPATDRRRLEAVVHKKGGRELLRALAAENHAALRVWTHQNNVVFRYGDTLLFVRQLDGGFPEYQRVVPQEWTTETTIEVRDFARALRAVAAVSSAGVTMVLVETRPDAVLLSIRNSGVGYSRAKLDVRVDGPPVRVGLNVNYVLDTLGAIAGDEVLLRLTDEFAPVRMDDRAADPGDAVFVIMPLKP